MGKRVLGLDFETTWTEPVNPAVALATEIGAILVDTDFPHSPLVMGSVYVWDKDYPISPKELVDLTGITDETLKEFGLSPLRAFSDLIDLMGKADYVCAHNGNAFDKILFEAECSRLGLLAPPKHWIDTRYDVPYPERIKTTKLSYLCAEHGFVNSGAHRALFDVQSMLRVLFMYDFDEVVRRSLEPTVCLLANVSFQERNLAKDRGFVWNPESKRWFKMVKESEVAREKENARFDIDIAQEI